MAVDRQRSREGTCSKKMGLVFNGLVLESFVAEVTQPEARVTLINVATSLNVERV